MEEHDEKKPGYISMGSDDDSKATALAPAIKSTGPRTEEGKAIASKNALKHGIFSNTVILTRESRQKYDSLWNGLCEDLKPVGTLEDFLVEKLAGLIWRYRRLIISEMTEYKSGDPPYEFDLGADSNSNILNRFPRYEASIERSFDRTLTQLERIQRIRLGQPVALPIKVDISSS